MALETIEKLKDEIADKSPIPVTAYKGIQYKQKNVPAGDIFAIEIQCEASDTEKKIWAVILKNGEALQCRDVTRDQPQ